MKQTTITCDKCGLSIQPLDKTFTGSSALVELHYSSQLGHSRVPVEGWQFHYSCFSEVVNAIIGALEKRG